MITFFVSFVIFVVNALLCSLHVSRKAWGLAAWFAWFTLYALVMTAITFVRLTA